MSCRSQTHSQKMPRVTRLCKSPRLEVSSHGPACLKMNVGSFILLDLSKSRSSEVARCPGQQKLPRCLPAMRVLGLPPEELKQAFQGPAPDICIRKTASQRAPPRSKMTVYCSTLAQLIFSSGAHGNFLLISGRYGLKNNLFLLPVPRVSSEHTLFHGKCSGPGSVSQKKSSR